MIRNQSGATLSELLVVVALMSVSVAAIIVYALPAIARESLRGAAYDVQMYLQLARVEAIDRNRDCRFVIDTVDRSIRVLDSLGTPATADDEVVHQSTLNSIVDFHRPDSGAAVTLQSLSGGEFGATFNSRGTVSAGQGAVSLLGGQQYRQVSLYGAGGVQIERWDGSAWVGGS